MWGIGVHLAFLYTMHLWQCAVDVGLQELCVQFMLLCIPSGQVACTSAASL